jgi:hypothetical protein
VNRSFALDTAALALLAAIALIMLVLIGHVRAEPLPQPKVGACPSGYTESVGATARPCAGTRPAAIPRARVSVRPAGCNQAHTVSRRR